MLLGRLRVLLLHGVHALVRGLLEVFALNDAPGKPRWKHAVGRIGEHPLFALAGRRGEYPHPLPSLQ